SAMGVQVSQALIRPATDQPTVAQISLRSQREVEVRATRGSVLFSYEDESQVIPEGSSGRIILDPTDEEISAATASPNIPSKAFPGQQPPRKGRKRRLAFIIFWSAVSAAVLVPILHKALESPDKP